jgi:uncharacterized repeat protein (TIGR01451 family)
MRKDPRAMPNITLPLNASHRVRHAARLALCALVCGAALVLPGQLSGAPGSNVTGTAFVDLDGSGDHSPGEPGASNVLVTIENDTGVVVTGSTGAKGEYAVELASPGPYRVRFSGWSETLMPAPRAAPDTAPVQFLSEGGGQANLALVDVDGCAVAEARPRCLAQIGDRVFLDLDSDGIQDAGEPGIPGVKITVRLPLGTLETSTDAAGVWFADVDPKEPFTVEVALDQRVLGALRPTALHAGADDIDSDGALDPDGKRVVVAIAGLTAGQAALSSADIGFVVEARLSILTQILDPSPAATWLDGDAVVGSAGTNDGILPMFAPNESGEFRVTLTNSGRADLLGIDLSDTACTPKVARTIDLKASEVVVIGCTAPTLTAPGTERFTASGARPVAIPVINEAPQRLGLVLPAIVEEAGFTMAAPSLEIVEEVQDPANALEWLDADPVPGPLGATGAQPPDFFSGETAHLRVRVRNSGNVTLDDILVADPTCGLSATLAPLAPGVTRTLTCDRPNLASSSTSTATASGATAKVHTSTMVGPLPPRTESAAVRVVRPAITILKEAQDPATGAWLDADAQAGSPGTNDGRMPLLPYLSTAKYRITVTNTGTAELVSVSVSDPMCSLATIVSTLAVGEARQLTCEVPRLTDERLNTATARGTGRIPGGEGRTAPNPTPIASEEAFVRVAPAPSAPGTSPGAVGAVVTPQVVGGPVSSGPVAVVTGGPARVKAAKSGPGKAVGGRTAVYEITVSVMNSSAVPARGVQVREILPHGMTVVAKQELGRGPWRHQRQISVWTLGDVAAGETRVVRVLVKIDPSLVGAVVTNRAEITAQNATRIVVGSKPTRIIAARRGVKARVTG